MVSKNKIDLDVRNLTTLSDHQLSELADLEISKWQEIKGGSFLESIEAWKNGDSRNVIGLCFLIENRPVGMTLFKRPPISPSWVSSNAATAHGLKISCAWQRQGLGRKAFDLSIYKLKEEWPGVTKLMLAVDADNVAALAIYRGFGMTECGPIREGQNGPEHRFEISLLP